MVGMVFLKALSPAIGSFIDGLGRWLAAITIWSSRFPRKAEGKRSNGDGTKGERAVLIVFAKVCVFLLTG